MRPLDVCGRCGEFVTPDSTRSFEREGDRCWVEWRHMCGQRGKSATSWAEYKPLLLAQLESKRLGVPMCPLSPDELGVRVQGWRVELDAVQTVADMTIMWDYQERTRPWTVRRER